MMMLRSAVVLLGCVLLTHPLAAATPQSPFAFSQNIHDLVESGHYDEALAEGIDVVTTHPDDPHVLHAVGRAAFCAQRYHLAIYYFEKALVQRPDYGASLLYLGWSQELVGLTDEARETLTQVLAPQVAGGDVAREAAERSLRDLKPPPQRPPPAEITPMTVSGAPRRQLPFFALTTHMAQLEYGGPVPKHEGHTVQVDLRAGLLGRGYVDLSKAMTTVSTLPYLPDYDISEYRIGFGLFLSPTWLLKAKYADMESVDGDGGNGQFGILGMDWLREGQWLGGVSFSHGDYPDGRVTHITPSLTWRRDAFSLTTAIDTQEWTPVDGSEETFVRVRQDLALPRPRGRVLYVGYAAGGSRYAYAGFGDIIYSLPDEQLSSAYIRYALPLHPFMLALKTSFDQYESLEGETYHSTAHTLSLTYLSQQARPLRTAEVRSPWRLAVGVGARNVSGSFGIEAADPLVTSVIEPLTFSDPTGQYTSRYAYQLDTSLSAQAGTDSQRVVAPWFELRRHAASRGTRWGLSLYGRYAFMPYGVAFAKQDGGYQAVQEIRSDFFVGRQFGGGSSVYETYDVVQSGRFDLNLHEFGLGAESSRRLWDHIEAGVGIGILMGIADWSSVRISEWTQASDGEVVGWNEDYGDGHELLVGGTADLRLRWEPSAISSWLIEAGAGYVYYGDLSLSEAPVAADLTLSSFNGTIALVIR